MVEFSLVWHAGHLMEAGDAGVVCWTEEPSISDSSSVIYSPFKLQTCSLFLSLTIFPMPVGLQGHTAPLHCFHLLLCVFHPRIWQKALSFLVAACLSQNYSLPTPNNVTSWPKSDLPEWKTCSGKYCVTAWSQLCRGMHSVHLRPQKSQLPKLHILVLLICITVAVPAKIRNLVKQGNDQV